jgi:hypothetical protein
MAEGRRKEESVPKEGDFKGLINFCFPLPPIFL